MTITIQEAIEAIIAGIVSKPFQDTVDVVKLGDPSQPLTGILITFLASFEVIEQARNLNANLIITHEPIFYNHLDKTDWLQNDAVYQAKRAMIESNNLVIWRFHDYLHSIEPDPVPAGLIHDLGWEPSTSSRFPVCQIPAMKLSHLVAHVKSKLNIHTLRIVGDLDLSCQTVAVVVGFPPSEFQLGFFHREAADVLICGEIHEWEASEYIRDAISSKQNKALVVIGHAASEESGIRAIIPWLQTRLPDVPIHFVAARNPFQYL